jgi:hypothetical protein
MSTTKSKEEFRLPDNAINTLDNYIDTITKYHDNLDKIKEQESKLKVDILQTLLDTALTDIH